MVRIDLSHINQTSGLQAAWGQLFNKRICLRSHPDICQLVTLYKEELSERTWKCHLWTQINLHTCCFGCSRLCDIAPTERILCKSELPLQTADKPILERPQRLFKEKQKKQIKAWMSSKQMLAKIQSCCCCASSLLLRGSFLHKLMLIGWTHLLVERRAQSAVYFSLLNENTLVNSIFDFNLIILFAKALFFYIWNLFFTVCSSCVSCQQNTRRYIFLTTKKNVRLLILIFFMFTQNLFVFTSSKISSPLRLASHFL